MKVLVTGGSGFLGTGVVAGLAAAGYEVTSGDLRVPEGESPARVRYIALDVTDAGAVSRAVAGHYAVVHLASVVGYPTAEVSQALAGLAAEYDEAGRGFELRRVAGGWRYYSREDYASVVEQFVLEGQQARLTQAALETLAVVAYKQPVSRSRVSAVRGVNVDGVMRTLLNRGLVEEAGQDQETGAHLYRTTGYFLDRIGVTSLEELPELAPFLPELDEIEEELGEAPEVPAPAAPATSEEGEHA